MTTDNEKWVKYNNIALEEDIKCYCANQHFQSTEPGDIPPPSLPPALLGVHWCPDNQ